MKTQQGPFTALIPSQNCDPHAPLFLILGWAGSQDRSLRKYAELLSSFGFPSIRSSQPTKNIFSPIEFPRRQWTESLLDFTLSRDLSSRPLILYAFSNGGGFIVEQMYKILHEKSPSKKSKNVYQPFLRRSLLGCIFDSAPGFMHHGLGNEVLKAEMAEPSLKRMLIIAGMTAASALTPILYGDRQTSYWVNMRNLDLGPCLYLYSDDDRLCDAERLSELLETKKASGQDVVSIRWHTSEHCGHLKHHKVEYIETLRKFLAEKLGLTAVQERDGGTPLRPPTRARL